MIRLKKKIHIYSNYNAVIGNSKKNIKHFANLENYTNVSLVYSKLMLMNMTIY